MKSRHLAAMETWTQRRHRRIFWIFALILLGLATAAFAQDEADPPGRVGFLSARQGGVVFAPQGEEEWTELPRNRPITLGDRLWTDRGARAEMQIGSATLHFDGETHIGVSDLDEGRAQFVVQQGSVNLRVRDLAQGENVEIDTPNLALRVLQPGDYRVDVDGRSGQTRVVVHSGLVALYGEGGDAIQMGALQQGTFAGRFLARVDGANFAQDEFGRWAADRNRAEDQSIAARHVPRGVIGATQLDPYGNWSQDPTYGAVWYPTVTVENWAPYRYGHWSWIAPWGWTWVDDAPWGFAPFHYGRWTMIGARWAWVPGRFAVRPVYSPALVVFLGGGGTRISFSSGPAVGWYPLAPGEAWWPVYRTSPRYVSYANFNINLNVYPRHYHDHWWRSRPVAVTAVGEDDFRRGRPVYRHWQPLPQHAIGAAQINVVPVRPEWRHRDEPNRGTRLLAAPPASVTPMGVAPAGAPRFFGGGREVPAAVHDQARARHDQERLQREAERAAREQQRMQEHARQQQDVQFQREQMLRRQQEQAARLQVQREAAQREAGQREAHRQQQEQAARHEQERAQREAWRQQREAARAQQQQQIQQQQQLQQQQRVQAQQQFQSQQHARPAHQPQVHQQVQVEQQVRVPQQQVRPVQQPAPAARGNGHGRGAEWGGEHDGHGGGRGHGGWQQR